MAGEPVSIADPPVQGRSADAELDRLFIPPQQFAKLGLLMQHFGTWNGEQVVSRSYVEAARTPTATNPCYGFLFWTNAGAPCISANFPATTIADHRMIESAPDDLFAMVGALQQNNFMIPSLGLTVTWTGILGDNGPNLTDLLSAAPGGSLYHEFFRILLAGVRDQRIPDPGRYDGPPLDLAIDPRNFLNPAVLLRGLFPAPDCNVLVCDGTIPLHGTAQVAEAVIRTLLAALRF